MAARRIWLLLLSLLSVQVMEPGLISSPSLQGMEHLEGEAYRYEEDMACGMDHNECSDISPGLVCKYVPAHWVKNRKECPCLPKCRASKKRRQNTGIM